MFVKMKELTEISFGIYKCSVCGKVEMDIPDMIAPVMCCEKEMERIGDSPEGVPVEELDFMCGMPWLPEGKDGAAW